MIFYHDVHSTEVHHNANPRSGDASPWMGGGRKHGASKPLKKSFRRSTKSHVMPPLQGLEYRGIERGYQVLIESESYMRHLHILSLSVL